MPDAATAAHGGAAARSDTLRPMIVTTATSAELAAAGSVSATTGGWRLVTQPDHARFAFELLRLWRGAELADHPRREDILFAAREHDNGWRELDAAPLWNATEAGGAPHDFRSMPARHRIDQWLRGSERFAAERPYAALLITLHALALNQRGEEDGHADEASPPLPERWDAMIDRLEEHRDALLEESGASAAEAADDYRFVRLADTASLTGLGVWGDGFELDVPGGPEADAPSLALRGHLEAGEDPDGPPPTLLLDPLPLAGATTFRIPVRYLPRRDYGDDVGLGVALATARWGDLRLRVAC